MDALSRRQVRNVAFLALGWSMGVAGLFIVVRVGYLSVHCVNTECSGNGY